MLTDTYRDTLAQARVDGAAAEREVADLRDRLARAEAQLGVLSRLIEGLEQMVGESSVVDTGARSAEAENAGEPPASGATPQLVDFTNTPDVERPKRVRSTDLVVEVIEHIGRPASRNEIYATLEELKGIPESWIAKPRNSFNNALGRALENGRIQKIGEELAPKDYNPFAADEPAGSGGQ